MIAFVQYPVKTDKENDQLRGAFFTIKVAGIFAQFRTK